MIKLFTAVATEKRILFFSSNLALLAPISTAIVGLLFPMQWECVVQWNEITMNIL